MSPCDWRITRLVSGRGAVDGCREMTIRRTGVGEAPVAEVVPVVVDGVLGVVNGFLLAGGNAGTGGAG